MNRDAIGKKRVPVVIDELGLIYGRDAIYLDGLDYNDGGPLVLVGVFNSALCESAKKDREFIHYRLLFYAPIDYRVQALDLYNQQHYVSSFEEIVDSPTINSLPASFRDPSNSWTYKHYVFHTYDHVIEVIAKGFDIEFCADHPV